MKKIKKFDVVEMKIVTYRKKNEAYIIPWSIGVIYPHK